MLVYIVTILLSVLIAKIGCTTNAYKNGNKIPVVLLSALPPIITSSIRYNVGTDYMSYYRAYINIKYLDNYNFEWLYKMLLRLIHLLFGNHYIFVLIATSLLFILPIYFYIFEKSPTPSLSIALVFLTSYYFAFLNGTRQMISAAIIFFSIRYIEKRKIIPYIICMIIAVGFHTTSIIFIPLYFAYNFKITPYKIVVIVLLMIVLSPILIDITKFLLSLTQYQDYAIISHTGFGPSKFLVHISVLALIVVFYKKASGIQSVLAVMEIISIFSIIAGSEIEFAHRISWTSGLSILISIPMIINDMKIKSNKVIVKFAVVILFSIYVYIYIAKLGGHDALPYIVNFKRIL